MKHATIFYLLVFFTSKVSFGQWTTDSIVHPADSLHQAYKFRMTEMYENVDLSQVPSGILYDRGIPFITFEPFRGVVNDSSEATLLSFGLAYASLSSMVVDPNKSLPNPNYYREKMDTITPESDFITVAGLHYNYHKIDTNSIANGQFEIIDNNIYDIFPRTGSPYVQHELFMFGPAIHKISSNTLKLFIDSTLFFTNTDKTIQSLAIDFGNDSGFVNTSFNRTVVYTYGEEGWKNITIKITYTDSSEYFSNFEIYTKAIEARAGGDNTFDIYHYIPPTYGSAPDEGRGGGTVWVYLGCGHTRIEKPFIWAEGFNPVVGGLNLGLSTTDAIDRLSDELAKTDPSDETNLWQNLQAEGYDIILIDYDDGGDYLPRTAELIKEVIRWVNIQKHSAGSNEKNVIMGQSMGGVCTNLALKEMEVVDMEDHEVATFVVFDSPILGVNVPLGAQWSLMDVAHLPVEHDDITLPLKYYVPSLDDAVDLLCTPAARTMIRYLHDLIPADQHLWQSHYEYQWNTLGGYPTQCEVINIANGSLFGEDGKHNFEPSEVIMSKSGNSISVISILGGLLEPEDADFISSVTATAIGGFITFLTGAVVNVDIAMMAAPEGESGSVYTSNIFVWSPLGENITIASEITESMSETSDKEGIDCAPGGFVGIGNQGIMMDNFDLGSMAPDIWKLETFCFTPTVSVLSYFDGAPQVGFNDPLHSFTDYNSNLSWLGNTGVKSYTSFDETVQFNTLDENGAPNGVFPTEFYNTAHTWFTNSNTKFMHFHFINGADELNGVSQLNSGTTYNFGTFPISTGFNFPYYNSKKTTNTIDHSITVSNTILGVNMALNLSMIPVGVGYPFPYGDYPVDNSNFLITIGNDCDNPEPITVTIEDGGQLVLGDGINRTGAVHVYEGHTIIVKDGGVLDIKEGSTLKLKSGSKLIIEGGGTVYIRNGAYLITESGTNIFYHPGAEIHLLGTDAVLEMEGQLNLFPDADFQLHHAGVASGLFVVKNPSGLISAGDNSSFQIIGDGPNDFMLAIMEGAKLSSDGNMSLMRISDCNVALRSGEWYNIRSHVPLYLNHVQFDAQPNIQLIGHPQVLFTQKGSVVNCTFNDVYLHGNLFTPTTGLFAFVAGSEFNWTYATTATQLKIEGGSFEIYGSTFNGFEQFAVQSISLVSTSKLYYSDFNGGNFNTSYGLYDFSDVEIRVQGSTFQQSKFGVHKSGGKLTLKCNSFTDIFHSAIYAGPNCWLEMSTGANAGYNTFSNILAWNITLDNALYMQLKYGYNSLNENGAPYPTITGDLQIGYPSQAKQYLHAHKNQWNPANTVPDPTVAELSSSITGYPIPVIMNNPQSTTCGFYDTGSPVVALPGGLAKLPNVKTPMMADSMRLDSALAQAFYLTETYNEEGDDFLALQLYHDILLFPFDEKNKPLDIYLDYGFYEMKSTLEHCFTTGRISTRDNVTAFHPMVQLYVDVLNQRSKKNITEKKYVEQFNLELSKAHLYRMIGYNSIGLNILYNTEACGLDSAEQDILNHWKFVFEEELVKLQLGPVYDSISRIYTDTNSYNQPTPNTDSIYYFGSKIISLKDIKYRTCELASRSMESDILDTEIANLQLYPNPSSDGLLNLVYFMPENSVGLFLIYSADGKEVYCLNCSSGNVNTLVDVSSAMRGVYFYSFIVDGINTSTGKFVLN